MPTTLYQKVDVDSFFIAVQPSRAILLMKIDMREISGKLTIRGMLSAYPRLCNPR